MDIQWVIIAQGHKLHPNKTIDIYRISHRVTVSKELNKAPIELFAKVLSNPIEVGTTKKLCLNVTHRDKGLLRTYDLRYQVPNLDSWMHETPYIFYKLNKLELPYTGEYIFSLLIDGEYKNEEKLIVIYADGGQQNERIESN